MEQQPQTRKQRVSHADLRNDINTLTMAQQRMSINVTKLVQTVGESGTDKHGRVVGTGIAGDLARLSARVHKYDGWVKFASGFMAAMFVIGPIIWWLIERRLEIFR